MAFCALLKKKFSRQVVFRQKIEKAVFLSFFFPKVNSLAANRFRKFTCTSKTIIYAHDG